MKTKASFLAGLAWLAFLGIQGQVVPQETHRRSGTFIAEWAKDTASIETYHIVENHLFGRAIHLFPEPHLQQYSYHFNEDGGMSSYEIYFFELKNTSVPLESKTGFLPYNHTMTRDTDSVYFSFVNARGKEHYNHATPRMDFHGGWIPILGQWQWLSDRARTKSLAKDLKFINSHVGVYGLRVYEKGETVIFESDISAPITIFPREDGQIEEIDTHGSPWNFTVKQIDPIDVELFTKKFADKPVVGNPSPYESNKTFLGSCEVAWAYGRPYKRGRQIFGKVVPYDQVWRTGAGSATILTFTEDLYFGDTMVPKGKYNLYTLPKKTGWTLIFNNEPNAWGSAHRPEYDVHKVSMKSGMQHEIVDQFTISIEETREGGILTMVWDDTWAKVTIRR